MLGAQEKAQLKTVGLLGFGGAVAPRNTTHSTYS